MTMQSHILNESIGESREKISHFVGVHKNKYDYSKFIYIGRRTKGIIICPEHGEFYETFEKHKNGKGCPQCQTILKNEKFIIKAKGIHSNKYDYSLVNYVKNNIKIKIICPEHGVFEQLPYAHLNGSGCPYCAGKNFSTEEMIEKFKKVHQDKYDYSKFTYVNNYTKGIIICPEHGEFLQTPNNHKNCNGCSQCGILKTKLTSETVIKQFQKTHKDYYLYNKFIYINDNTKGIIICPKHGEFLQLPFNHKSGQNCPQCKTNKKEEFIISLFKEYNINCIYNDRNLIKPLEIDILVPDFNFGIEHNGLAFHSYGKSNWSAINNYDKLDRNKHLNKTIEMEKANYQLLHIREDHLLNENKKDIWKSILLNKCGISHKKDARKLQIIDLSNHNSFVKEFLENNHLQGSCPASIQLGLQDPKTGGIYSIMTFGKSRFNKNIEYELLRFCNLKFHNVRGAASKLLKAFERMYKPSSLISYANRDWSQGNLYSKLGFTYSHVSEPNYVYFYIKNMEIIQRQTVQKHKLKDFLESRNLIFKEELSERDNMILNGFRIYYDTGNLVYIKKYKREGVL